MSISVGINIAAIADWNTQDPFIDHFKTSRDWITQRDYQWDTGERHLLELTANGWPRSLPPANSPLLYRYASTLVFNGRGGNYKPGRYYCGWKGKGRVDYSHDGKRVEAESVPGWETVEVINPTDGGVKISIKETDPNDPVRDIIFVHVDDKKLYDAGEIFNPVFLEKIAPFSTIRFMDWGAINNSPITNWADRPLTTHARWISGKGDKGCPIEVMVALCNKLKRNMWICMPHKASFAYMSIAAELVAETLDPNLHCYVEFSNEIWNWGFQQSQYALAQSELKWPGAEGGWMQWYGKQTAIMGQEWAKAFADRRNKLTVVMGVQTGWKGLEQYALNAPKWVEEGNQAPVNYIDALACTAYFSGDLHKDENLAVVQGWAQNEDFTNAFQQLRDGSKIPNSKDHISYSIKDVKHFKELADRLGKQLIGYEAGQHLVQPNSQLLTDFFIKLNRHEVMGDLYHDLLHGWMTEADSLVCLFNDVGMPNKWGSWGLLEDVGQHDSPKYNSTVDFIDDYVVDEPDPDPTNPTDQQLMDQFVMGLYNDLYMPESVWESIALGYFMRATDHDFLRSSTLARAFIKLYFKEE